ncbi:hypothetical protein [Castellaniella sp. S9]|uniref:hypothetical protein n=1 Tax=Castellaniella sp. S9 TaxID=2993652 RepID=UPI0022B45549|nr:hypothetical protein [Castellaniella sp. S9]
MRNAAWAASGKPETAKQEDYGTSVTIAAKTINLVGTIIADNEVRQAFCGGFRCENDDKGVRCGGRPPDETGFWSIEDSFLTSRKGLLIMPVFAGG